MSMGNCTVLIKSRWAREGLTNIGSNSAYITAELFQKTPGSKICSMQQTAGAQRNQKMLLQPSVPKTSGEHPPQKGLDEVPWASLQIKQGRPVVSWWQIWGMKEPVSSGFSFSLASVYLGSWNSGIAPRQPCWPHSFNHSAYMCWVSTRDRHWPRPWNQVLNKKGKDPANMRCSSQSHTYVPNRHNFKHVVYFISEENAHSSPVAFQNECVLLPMSRFFSSKGPFFFEVTKCIVLNGSKNKRWKLGTFGKVLYCSQLC